jgi:hypothetical protein
MVANSALPQEIMHLESYQSLALPQYTWFISVLFPHRKI